DLSDTAGANTEAIYTSDGITANSTQLEQLKKLFPACFDADGNFLIDRLQAEIAPQTDIGREFYEMNWLGKSYARLLRNLPPETLISEDKTHNAKPENAGSQNLLIRGDNLEVLKHLKNAYANSVKMIYIDPPYNTGSDGFVYQDDRKFTPAELARLANIDEEEAARILDFTDKGSNSHSAWLTFMYPRLYIARELLKDDGVIFISIDDNEAAQLKLLCDEVFGEGNFVGQICWQKKTGASDAKGIATITEFVLAYMKSESALFEFTRNTESFDLNRYKYQDNYFEERGAFYYDNLDRGTLGYIESLDYPVKTPDGSLIYPNGRSKQFNDGWRWKWSKTKVENGLKNGFIEVRKNQKTGKWGVYYKIYHLVDNDGNKIERSSPHKSLIQGILNTHATNEAKEIFGSSGLFTNPKPVELVSRLISFINFEDDLILDFFAGSGTTAHAVMQLNAEEQNGSRRYICVQLPEKTDEKSEAHKAGYPTIFDITKARIEKAAAKIRAEHPDYTGDLGFKIFQTADNFRQHPDKDFSPDQPDLPLNDELSEEQLQTLLTTWTLYDGAALTTPVEPVRLGSYTAYLCEKRLYLMNAGFTSADLLAFIRKLDDDADFNPNRVIVFGSNMASAMQHELDQAVRGYTNKKEIELNVIIRV
ncbi:TPA: site-specific DNA-methyltransferase, partial [Neisseria meningitidis]